MSVRTAMDDKYDNLKEELDQLIKKAKELMCDEETWGWDDYREGYREDVYIALRTARKMI